LTTNNLQERTIIRIYFKKNPFKNNSIIADYIRPNNKEPILLIPDNSPGCYCPISKGPYFVIESSIKEWEKRKPLTRTKNGVEIYTIRVLKVEEEVILPADGTRIQIFITSAFLPNYIIKNHEVSLLFKFSREKTFCLIWIENNENRKNFAKILVDNEKLSYEFNNSTGVIKVCDLNVKVNIDDFYNIIVNSIYDFYDKRD